MTTGFAGESQPEITSFPAPVEDPENRLRQNGFVVGEWLVDPRAHTLTPMANAEATEAQDMTSGREREKRIDPRLISLLVTLAAEPGVVLTRDELLTRVWRDTFVNENSLSQAISRLRRALGDNHSDPRYIETVSRSGYRLIATVHSAPSPETASVPPAEPSPNSPHLGPAPAVAQAPRRRDLWLGLLLATAVVTMTFAAVFWRARQPTSTVSESSPSPPLVLRPEVTLPGNQFEPRLSPDGRDLVFAWRPSDSTSGWDLWLQPLGGDQPVRLTEHAHDERLPAWSGNARKVAFVRYSTEDDECGLFAVEVLSRRVERLTDCHPGTRSLAWSPDGQMLVHDGFTKHTRVSPASNQLASDPGPRALFVINLETGERRQLTSPVDGSNGDTGARISPDGSLVAFEREITSSHSEIVVVVPESGEARTLAPGHWGRIRGLDWTAAGNDLLVSSDRSGRYELWKVPLDDAPIKRLPISDGWVTQPTVSRTSDTLVFRTFRDKVDLWEITLDEDLTPSGEPRRVVESSRSERQPALSRTGDRIAFVSDRTGTSQIWSSDSAGQELRRHTNLVERRPSAPRLANDGKSIAFELEGLRQTDIWAVGADARIPKPLVEGPGNSRNPSFSHDGRTLYIASDRGGEWQIWRRPLGDRLESESFADHAGGVIGESGGFRALESHDGKWVYYTRLDEPGLWRVPSDGGTSELVTAELSVDDWAGWDLSRNDIFVIKRSPASLWRLSLDGTQSTKLADAPLTIPYLEPSLSTSADGQQLLVALIERGDDELMVLDLDGF